jgi:hypothetical protein
MVPREKIAEVAKEAFIYGYPIVDAHNIIYQYVLDKNSKEFKAPFNQVGHNRNVTTPRDHAIVSSNVDTPYSYAWLDLRVEPVVLSIPPFDEERYVSVELIDLYSYIVGYISPRTSGNKGGDYLVAGPDWHGVVPPGVRSEFHSPTRYLLAMYRTQLFNPGDIGNVHALQDQFKVQGLSAYDGKSMPPPPPPFLDVRPIDIRKEPESLQFFAVLNAMLAYMPVLKEETALRERFAEIGIVPGASFSVKDESTEKALIEGMHQGLLALYARAGTVKSSAELFGSREYLKDDYLSRAVGALLGIYGNAAEEYLGVGYATDSEGKPFDGNNLYRIKFVSGGLPPVDAFWSITAYNASKFLIENPIDRYVINSPMLPSLKKDTDGGFTLYLQVESPGEALESNWLPVSRDAFNLAFRTYQPGKAIFDGTWQAPPVVQVK